MNLFLGVMEPGESNCMYIEHSARQNGGEFSVFVLAATQEWTASALWVHQPLLFIVLYKASRCL